MTKYISLFVFIFLLLGCSKTKFESHDHSPAETEEHGHGHGEGGIENIKFTGFSENYQLFAEMTPMIKGKETKFTVHFTKLSDFKPINSGSLKIEISGDINETLNVDEISRPGIFTTSYTPKSSGSVNIAFIYLPQNGNSETIRFQAVESFATEEEAKNHSNSDERGITFLLEEAWQIDFGLLQVFPGPFSESIKATGKIINNPADEITITAASSGTIVFADQTLTPGMNIPAGKNLFSIKPSSMREDNFELRYGTAKSNFQRAKKEYERISELYKSKITSEREYLEAKSDLEKAEVLFNNFANSNEGKSINIKSPKSGYLKNLFVSSGQFVEAGSVLAVITNNNKLAVKVDIPYSDFNKVKNVSDCNFVINEVTYKLKDLNGKVSGTPVSSNSSSYVSIYFQIDNKINLLPNTYVTAYIYGNTIQDAIVVPKVSVWEDQGNFFVFVQKNGELYEKRPISLGGFDGISYWVSSGLQADEVIVTKGTYRVMLASKKSDLPAQTHAH